MSLSFSGPPGVYVWPSYPNGTRWQAPISTLHLWKMWLSFVSKMA